MNENDFAKDEELEHYALRRIKVCRECEHYKMFVCTQCGCIMPIKTRIKQAACPINKWLPET
jgi:Fe2+ or Zn2+ uptake regulation protein